MLRHQRWRGGRAADERGQAEELGLKPMARWIASAAVGVNPRTMGYGPIPATRKVLERAGLTVADIDLFEINEPLRFRRWRARESWASRSPTQRQRRRNRAGHPLGCSGARLMTTLVHELKRRQGHFGLATLCVGVDKARQRSWSVERKGGIVITLSYPVLGTVCLLAAIVITFFWRSAIAAQSHSQRDRARGAVCGGGRVPVGRRYHTESVSWLTSLSSVWSLALWQWSFVTCAVYPALSLPNL